MKVTIKEIAREANTSTATVSHVLNKTRYVSPELSDRVLKIAREKGYRLDLKPDVSFRQGRLSVVALVMSNRNELWGMGLAECLTRKLAQLGYTLSIYMTNGDAELERHIIKELVTDKKVAGIFLVSPCGKEKEYYKLVKAPLPVVFVDMNLFVPGARCVYSDFRESFQAAVEDLLYDGHEKILLLLSECGTYAKKEITAGYLAAYEKYGAEADKEMIVHTGVNLLQELSETIKRKDPTAILAWGNVLAKKTLSILQSLNLKCPEDVSLIGLNHTGWEEFIRPGITGFSYNVDVFSNQMVSLLPQTTNTDKPEKEKICVPLIFTHHASTQSVMKGPLGERVVSPEKNFLTAPETAEIKKLNKSVAILFD